MRNDETARICIACLATNVKMCSMRASDLLEPYQLLTGLNDIGLIYDMPESLCLFCAALVHKFYQFRNNCLRAFFTLQNLNDAEKGLPKMKVEALSPLPWSLIVENLLSLGVGEGQQGLSVEHKPEPKPEHDDENMCEYYLEDFSDFEDLDEDEPGRDACASGTLHAPAEENGEKFLGTYNGKTVKYVYAPECIKMFKIESIPIRGRFECAACRMRFATRQMLRDHAARTHATRHSCCYCDHSTCSVSAAQMHYKSFHENEMVKKNKLDENREIALPALASVNITPRVSRTTRMQETPPAPKTPFVSESRQKSERLCASESTHASRSSRVSQSPYAPAKNPRLSSPKSAPVQRPKRPWKVKPLAKNDPKPKPKLKATPVPNVKQGIKKSDVIDATEVIVTQELLAQEMLEMKRQVETKRPVYYCDFCYKIFARKNTLTRHKLNHDPMLGPFECDVCKFRLPSRTALHAHISARHTRQYHCNLCPNVTFHRSTAMNHYMWHLGITFECPKCDQSFSKKGSMLSHLRIKHPSPHICPDCGESFVSPNGLQQHMKITHRGAVAVAAAALSAADVPPAARGEARAAPRCDACGVQFASRRAWSRHAQLAHADGPHVADIRNGCARCGETFPSRAELRAHVHVHHARASTNNRPWISGRENGLYRCPQCGEDCDNRRAFYRHFKLAHPCLPYPHRSDLSQVCDECGKGFRCLSLLKLHKLEHSGVRQFKCNDCPKSFFTPLSLKNHSIQHSAERPHVCEVCGTTFNRKGNLDRHMHVHSSGRRFVCGECGRTFSCLYWTRHHVRTVHGGERIPSKPRVRSRPAGAARPARPRSPPRAAPPQEQRVVRLEDLGSSAALL